MWIIISQPKQLEETFSNYDGNAKEDVDLKINTFFLVGISQMTECLSSLTAPHVNLITTYEGGVEFQMET